MKWIAFNRQSGEVKSGDYNQLSNLDKRLWHIEPAKVTARYAKHQLNTRPVKNVAVKKSTSYKAKGKSRKSLYYSYKKIESDRLISAAHYNNFAIARKRLFDSELI